MMNTEKPDPVFFVYRIDHLIKQRPELPRVVGSAKSQQWIEQDQVRLIAGRPVVEKLFEVFRIATRKRLHDEEIFFNQSDLFRSKDPLSEDSLAVFAQIVQ